jgi:crotonobetainyl-CoA:carnitine CoA-transferase CaiB-like acyl-CoA transferase
MSEALKGIKVIDVSQVAAVPMCARHLADFGAEVIHIENPKSGDSWRGIQEGHGGNIGPNSKINYNWEHYNRNKKSVTIDLSSDEGKAIIYKLAQSSDVFVTNLRLWEREKFQVDYESLKKINPRLVYGSLTALGKKGPEKNNPGYDTTSYWARSGLQYVTKSHGIASPTFRAAMGDNLAGLALAFGIMMALFVRERTGQGQEVDTTLLQVGYYQITFDIASALATKLDYSDWKYKAHTLDTEKEEKRKQLEAEMEQATNRLQDFIGENSPNAFTGLYNTKDNRNILFTAPAPDRYWPEFCRVVGHPELENNPKFNSLEARSKNREEFYHIFKDIMLSKTLAEWRQLLSFLPCSGVLNLKEAISDPQARLNDMFVKVDHPVHGPIEVLANPVVLNKTPASYGPAPEFNQHTEEVLLDIGYTWEDITRLKEKGIIA